MKNDHIKNHWDNQAKLFPESHQASWGDQYCIDLEIEAIRMYLSGTDCLLDIGCANGLSSLAFLEHGVAHVTGVDFSEEMIAAAEKNSKKRDLEERSVFKVGDIRNLEFDSDLFRVTNTTRVLINLPTWEEQRKGIDEALRVTIPGGTALFSEAFYEPLVKLNALREVLGLAPLREQEFNFYLSTKKMEQYLNEKGAQFSCIPISSMYYLGTRIIRELIVEQDQVSEFSNDLNATFFDLQRKFTIAKDIGIQKLYVVTVP